MPKVVVANEKREIEVPEGANLREELRKAGMEVYKGLHRFLNCHGLGLCGTCQVLVKKGMENLAPNGMTKEEWEQHLARSKKDGAEPAMPKTLRERLTLDWGITNPLAMMGAIGHENEARLSCQVRVFGDCTIETQPTFNWSGENFWQKPYPNK